MKSVPCSRTQDRSACWRLRHGYLAEYYVDDAEFIVKIPQGLKEIGVLLESTTVGDCGCGTRERPQ